MSFATLQHAFAAAERQLARLGGLSPTAAGNVLYNGATYTGLFGNPRPQESMNPGGGNRRVTEVTLTLTRDQFETAPLTQTNLTRTDLSPQITYRVANIDEHDPVHYVLTLMKVG